MNPKVFIEKKARWEAEADDQNLQWRDRIYALTELYFLHQHDVHNQAKYIRKIQDIVEGRA